MKVTGGDIRDLLCWGAGGLASGVVYQLASIWIRQKTNSGDLDPPTEALHEDQELLALFCQLQEYRTLGDNVFRRAVDDADRLVFLHLQLRNKDVAAALHDRPHAFLYLKHAVENLERLLTLSQDHPMPRVPVEVHRLYVLIFTCLETHWNGILHLTRTVGGDAK